ncbi:MAG: SIMPL domain-containing protein, partial [Acidobacteria bacterium]|nr:SIMPL domain-containing protein [Acidobacteriota bacterium]
IYASADGKFDAPPDTAELHFDIAAREDTAKAAYEHASRDGNEFRQVLQNNGIDPKAAEIGYYMVQPVYDWKNSKRKLIAYRVASNVRLKLKDFSKIASILERLADNNIGENQSLVYTLENMDAAKARAVEDAYHHARMNAETLAQAGSRILGDLSYASVDSYEQVRPMALAGQVPVPGMRAQAEAVARTEQFTPQNVTVTAHVNVLFNVK